MGITYIHEHLYVMPDELRKNYAYTLDNIDKSIDEACSFKKAGGVSIVELTPLGYGRNTEVLRIISKRSGINIICVTGFHKQEWLPRWFDQLSDNEIISELTHEITDGIGYSKVKPGAIKIGTSFNEITTREYRAINIVAPLAQKFHIPIITHCDKGTMGNEQLDLLTAKGVDLGHVCLSHTDLTLDVDYLKSLVSRGASLSIDHIGRDLKNHDQARINIIVELIHSGYRDKLCLAGDMGKKSYFKSYGGYPGLSYILTEFKEYILHKISEDDFYRMIIQNPRAILNW